MKINKIIKNKALPSFCTANIDVLNSILYFCRINKLPCLVECTSNQVNQYGGYTNKTPKIFMKEILNLRKKINLNKNQLFLGGDHLGPLPWKNNNKKVALKNSIELINSFLKNGFYKIHIDTSIKCKDDKFINSEIVFNRTNEILKNPKIKKKIKDNFLIIGTEVPLSGSGDKKQITLTSKKQIEAESLRFKNILKSLNLQDKSFGLVIEPGMKYMHSSITRPNFNNFLGKKKISKKNNFVFEAHSTDYQSKNILRKLVSNNFKFLKVGPELTYNYSRALFFMHDIEKRILKKNNSEIKKNILLSMQKNKQYWKGYYNEKNKELFLNSKLDRMRYYFNSKLVVKSLKILKNNINKLDKEIILTFIEKDKKKDFLNYKKEKLSNFDNIKLIYISKSLKKYFHACGFNFS